MRQDISKGLFACASLVCFLVLSGCRWEVGKSSSDDASPTPTVSPTATPTNSVTAVTVTDEASETNQSSSLSAEVATASADFFAETTSAASESAAAAQSILLESSNDSDALAGAVSDAKISLAAAKEAYIKSEATVFFVDPESSAELRSQPDPFAAATYSAQKSPLDALQSALTKLEALLAAPLDSSTVADLLAEQKTVSSLLEQTEAGLRDMADAWKPGDADNFRSEYFLVSPESAMARIFQGLLAMTGDLLPKALEINSSADTTDLLTSVSAVSEIYMGKDENTPSLHTLVLQASPVQAALTRASLVRVSALASVLDIIPNNESAKDQLTPALQDLTRQLTYAANTLGIVIISEE